MLLLAALYVYACLRINWTRNSATTDIARDAAIEGRSRSSVVVPIDAA